MFYRYENDLEVSLNEANSNLLRESVYENIKNQLRYDMCNANSLYLAERFSSFFKSEILHVKVYYPKWRFSKAYGYFSKGDPLSIYVNGYRFFKLDKPQKIALLYHEAGHAMDVADKSFTYHHGDNDPTGKENTFQYSLNRFVYAFYDYENIYSKPLSLWQRFKRWF